MEHQLPIIDLEREEIEEARRVPEWRKLELGGELFDEVCARMREGICFDMPNATPDEVTVELRRRLEINRRPTRTASPT